MMSSVAANSRIRSVTLKDVAAHAGVDKGSVSVVLNGAKSNTGVSLTTRERILAAARELDYRPNPLAQRLATPYAGKHIDIFSLMLDAGIGVRKLKTLQALLIEQGYDVPVHSYDFYGNTESEEARKLELIRTLRHQKPRAIVCATPGVSEGVLAEVQRYIEDGGIAVCYDDAVSIPCDNVVFDVEDNIFRAARHLIERGHHRIGLFWQGNKTPRGAVRLGFERALSEAGIELNPKWLFGSFQVAEEGGAELARDFLALDERPTGMIIISDYSAFSFMVELGRAGLRVPNDVSVIGHDNLSVAPYCPTPLSSVSHPAHEIARSAFELLQSRLTGEYDGPPRRFAVRGELIERQSVRAL